MTILWAGGEDINFPNGSVPNVSTNEGRFYAGYARCALFNSTAPMLSTPFPGGAVTSCWVSCQLIWIPYTSYSAGRIIVGLSKTGKNGAGLYVLTSATDLYKLALYTFDGVSTWTQLGSDSTTVLSVTGIYKIDMQLTSYGASANVKIYCAGVECLDFTGDVRIASMTDVDMVGAMGWSYYAELAESEFIVADVDTRALRLVTHAPNAAGDLNEWDGAYTDADEITNSDADVIYTNTDSEDFQTNLIDTPAGDFSVHAFSVVARACKSADASVGSLKLGIKSGGTIAVDSVADELSLAWATYEHLMQTNPVTTNAFTKDELDALQIDLQSVA